MMEEKIEVDKAADLRVIVVDCSNGSTCSFSVHTDMTKEAFRDKLKDLIG